MINNIIFLMDFPFSQRDFNRFGIELLLGNGFNVEFWDLTDILHPQISKHYTPPDPIDWPGIKIYSDKKNAFKKIRELTAETFIINVVAYSPKSCGVYRSIAASQAAYAVIKSLAIPTPKEKTKKKAILSLLKRLPRIVSKKAPNRIIKYLGSIINQGFYRLPHAWMGIKPANMILAGGEKCLVSLFPVDKNTEILWAHTLDYDLYLKERNEPVIEQPMAVFIDEYMPFHVDSLVMGVQPPITPDRYYPVLNKFFNTVERQLGVKVVIAAHPRSQYEKHPDYFEGRECIRGKTIQLIKESKLVLAHSSTSLNFANLFQKPIIFITMTDLDKSFQGPYIWAKAEWFGHKPIFMDSDTPIDWARELTVNDDLYQRYRQAYIKTEHSEDIPFWQIVANRLKRM